MRTCLLGWLLLLGPCGLLLAQPASERSAETDASLVAEGGISLERLLQRYSGLYGGLRDEGALSSIAVEGKQYQGSREFEFSLRKRRPGSIRYRLEHGTSVLESGFNGRIGWIRREQAGESSVEILSGQALDSLRREADFDGPLVRHLENPEIQLSIEGSAQVGSHRTVRIRAKAPGEPELVYFLDPQSLHILRMDQLNDQGAPVLQTLYRDYREIRGYPIAFEVETRAGGQTRSVTRIDEIQINPGLLSFLFEVPSS